jgi:hypothetical protein
VIRACLAQVLVGETAQVIVEKRYQFLQRFLVAVPPTCEDFTDCGIGHCFPPDIFVAGQYSQMSEMSTEWARKWARKLDGMSGEG